MNEDILLKSKKVIEGHSDSLDLSGLGLTKVPDIVFQLNNLRSLNISNNNIDSIPSELVRMHSLKELVLTNNPITNPPIEVCLNGLDSLKKYYEQLENVGTSKLFEAKVVIIGEGGAGKTSFARKFRSLDSELPRHDESTRGIEITSFMFSNQDEQEFRLNIWDFGGQEIYHATHQFFLSKRTLYVLVADTRSESPNFNYWLNIANVLGGNSPLLIVLNEKEDRCQPIDEFGIKSRFSNIRSILKTNILTGRGIKEAIDEVKFFSQKLPHIGDDLPKTWVDIRNNLQHNRLSKIPLEDYFKVCNLHSVFNRSNALVLSQYLHDLGVVLHFMDSPVLKNIMILNPAWTTNAVYKIIDNKTLHENKGEIDINDVIKALEGQDSYLNLEYEIIELMKRYEICYEIQPNKYLIPQMLPSERPLNMTFDYNRSIVIKYKYDFLPKGVLSRLIVRLNNYIHNSSVWKYGAYLLKSDSLALVEEIFGKNEIKITINGDQRKEFMVIITEGLDNINNYFESLQFEKLIPCNCSICEKSQEPYFYLFDSLTKRLNKGKNQIECDNSFEEVSIKSLLGDVGFTQQDRDDVYTAILREFGLIQNKGKS